ncbi:hypothetical protein F5Y16DRAFT_369090 [Xylariaceae sp. FL0255]|nr:hypothetical protein F5Y16DRAFT_369090 [Xylariaceae sp. FL0255]
MESPPASDHAVDLARPFQGLVLCCTSIEADQRSEIAQRTADMGGVHKYDLTPDVTHLIVGDYDTPKYRHVAKERPDIKSMAAAWVDAIRQLWLQDQEFDFEALEKEWMLKPFESGGGIPKSPVEAERERQRLVCCLTGFEDNIVRAMIEEKVKSNGGIYVADLSRKVTHLIVAKPEGKKYLAARKWNIHCVTIEWLHDSVERGMILLEDCYDPNMQPDERGKDAWTRREVRPAPSAKRLRDGSVATADQGRRKLRKSASMRMTTQSHNIWGDILNQSAGDLSRSNIAQNGEDAFANTSRPSLTRAATIAVTTANPAVHSFNNTNHTAPERGILSGCLFHVDGFSEAQKSVVFSLLTSYGGQLTANLDDLSPSSKSEFFEDRYLLVPQLSRPDTHPLLPDGAHIITEFFIERCIHSKTRFSPQDHILGQPFPRFPVDGFENLTICTTGFMNEQLNQVEKTVTQLGATYSEKLNRLISVVVSAGLSTLKLAKRELAILHNIPIVSAEWLWQCVATGCLVPWDEYQFEELTRTWESTRAMLRKKEDEKAKETAVSKPAAVVKPVPAAKNLPPVPPKPNRPTPPLKAGVDTTAFEDDSPQIHQEEASIARQETGESQYETAPAHPIIDISDGFASVPLSETTSNNLNKPPSPTKEHQQHRKLKRFPTSGTVGDSEAGDDSDTASNFTPDPNCDPEAERKRIAQLARDKERQEMSKRLSALMSNDTPLEGNSIKPQSASASRVQRRKREILGRATSNVSATSSASAGSASALSSSEKSAHQHDPASASGEKSELDKYLVEPSGDQDPADTDNAPPATQLEYDNPEARRHRQDIMDRIMGKKRDDKNRRQSQEKVRLSDFVPIPEGTSTTRRTTRRQGRE